MIISNEFFFIIVAILLLKNLLIIFIFLGCNSLRFFAGSMPKQ